MLNQQIIIYAHQYQAPQVVYAVQHDTGRTLTFVPGDFQIPAGATAQLWCKTPSGVLSFAAGTVSGQEITAALTEYNLAEAGNNLGQLQISADGDYIKAFSFILRVQEEVNGEELTPEEMTLLEQAIAEMQAEISTQLAAFEDEMDNLVPKTREINGHALDQDVTLTPGDIGAAAEDTEINGHPLTGDIDLTPGDIGAVPDTRTVNNYEMDEDITLHAVDIPFTPTPDIEATNVQNAINEAVGLMSEAHEDLIYTNTGTTSAVGDYTLTEDISGYQYLDILFNFQGEVEIRRIPVDDGRSFKMRFSNLADSESSKFFGLAETNLSFSGTTMTIELNKYLAWPSGATEPELRTDGRPYVVTVNGVKYDAIGGPGGGVPIVIDDALSPNSENPVQNKVIYNALENVEIAVDDELDASSENPVQNKVIYQALQDDGVDSTAKELIITILQNADYSLDQSANIIALAGLWNVPIETDPITIDDVVSALRSATVNTVNAINAAASDSINFVVLTDTHGAANGQNSQNVVRFILKNSKAKRMFWLGDLSQTNWSSQEYETFAAPLLNCASKVYPTLGNHEYFGGTDAGRAEIYDDFLAGKAYLVGNPSHFYYYLDDEATKIRYIVMNTSDGSSNAFSSGQLSWLQAACQLPTSEWGIIAFSHFPLTNANMDIDHVTRATYDIRDALLATNGTVICYISGHLHADDIRVIDYAFYEVNLKNDSVSGQAISVFSIDPTTHTVDMYRIGYGEDDTFDYDDLPVAVNYTITNTLTGCSNTNEAASVIGGRPYSGTLVPGTNYDLDTGTVAITMGGNDITSTAYNTSTHAISIASVTGNVEITAVASYNAPITEFTPTWLIRGTQKYPKLTFSTQPEAGNGWPTNLAIITCNGTTSYPTGFRNGSYARYSTRTSGYTARNWAMKSMTNTSNVVTVTVDTKKYTYCNITKTESDTAYANYQNDIANNGGIDYNANAGIEMYKNASLTDGHDYWVLDQEVTAENVASIVRRLPSHVTE